MSIRYTKCITASALALAVAWIGLNTSSASPIDAGFDLFSTLPGTFVDLTPVGLSSNVPMQGVPFKNDKNGDPVDTVVERKQGVDPFEPISGTGDIDIELVALSLVSVTPLDLTALGGPFVGISADLHTTINKDGAFPGITQLDVLPPSLGKMTLLHDLGPLPTDDIGGRFDSAFGDTSDLPVELVPLEVSGGGIFANAIFTVVGGDPANPLDVLFSTVAPKVVLWSIDSRWEHSEEGFQVIEINHVGPHPVEPRIVPEPATFVLLLLGLGIFRVVRRRTA